MKRNVRLHMRERRFEKVCSIFLQEDRVAYIWIGNCGGIEQRYCDLVHLDQLEHPGQQHTLELEARFVIGICENEEDILHDAEEILLEECIRDCWIGTSKVIDNFHAHFKGNEVTLAVRCLTFGGKLTVETRFCDVTHRVFDSPNNTIHEELELCRGYRKESYDRSHEYTKVSGT